MKYPRPLFSVFNRIKQEGGKALVVGGAVRDYLMGHDPKDYDVEVYGIQPDSLHYILSNFGKVNAVGKSFGVLKLKLDNVEYDFSIPRRESKQGKGHKGFLVQPDPTLSPADAAARRDFTINAIAFDPITCEVLDFHGGVDHIAKKLLHPTSEAFKEDPLRVLRAMQFIGRFGFAPTGTLSLYSFALLNEYKDLPVERVWGEWEKLLLKGNHFYDAINFLVHNYWIENYPELSVLQYVKQDPEWHPEGGVLEHTSLCLQAAAYIANKENLQGEDRIVYLLAVLCHDLGKATTTIFKDGRWRAPGHDEAGIPLTESFLTSIGCPPGIIERVKPLVKYHMAHCNDTISKKFVRKIAVGIAPATIRELNLVVLADMSGRPPLPAYLPDNAKRIEELAKDMDIETKPVAPILMGRHLLEKGLTPGPEYGRLLKEAFEEQLNGTFTDLPGALLWLEEKCLR